MAYLDYFNLSSPFTELDDVIDLLEDCKSTNLVRLDEDSTKSLTVLESIIKTAILNELDPYDYMQYLLHMVSTPDVEFGSLLPWNLKPGTVKKLDIFS